MATIREVAKLAGVSPATVSRVLSGDPGFSVREETRLKINDAVARLRRDGYHTVTAHMYPGMRHELLNHTNRMQVYEDLLSIFDGWL